MAKVKIKSYTIQGVDETFISVSETVEGSDIVLSIQRNGQIETARLDYQGWNELMNTRYELNINRKE